MKLAIGTITYQTPCNPDPNVIAEMSELVQAIRLTQPKGYWQNYSTLAQQPWPHLLQ